MIRTDHVYFHIHTGKQKHLFEVYYQEDLVEKLTELKELHEKKILSDEEFAAAKKKILGE